MFSRENRFLNIEWKHRTNIWCL